MMSKLRELQAEEVQADELPTRQRGKLRDTGT